MVRDDKKKIRERDLSGFKYFKKILRLLGGLHETATARDRAHNRTLHYDQHTALILLYLFNPIVTSLRGIEQASQLRKVQRKLGCLRASLGSLSEANRVFDSSLLLAIIAELASELRPISHDSRLDEVQGVLTLVDGTLLTELPRVVAALWLDEQHRAFKLHTQFELLKGVPVQMDLTDANDSEVDMLAESVLPGRVYVLDRGYAAFRLFAQILRVDSSLVCRIRDNSAWELIEERELSDEAKKAGIVSDRIVRLGCPQKRDQIDRPLRVIEIKCTPHRKRTGPSTSLRTGKTGRGGPEQGETILIATDLLHAPAEVIALIYQQRWCIEIFFRFFKHILGCRHLLAHNRNGIEIQTYMAIIACLLIALWTGKKPTLRTYEMVCFYLSGLADEDELDAHIAALASQPESAPLA